MSVSAVLLRLYRPVIVWGLVAVVAVEITVVTAILTFGPMSFSFWLVVLGSAAKYWPLVTGILLISTYFRQFVTNGVTRHEFLRALAVFSLGVVLVVPALVVLGHAAESLVLDLLGGRGGSYPAFRFGEAAAEFLHVLPATAGYLASGILISAGFYRFRVWIAVLFIVPGAVPALVTEILLKLDEYGEQSQNLPLAIALTLSGAATVAAAIATHRVMRDVAVKRTAV
ncbi:MAG: hypothetical protein SYR96_17025 [Actinomycetota bacterium]|nr:hypothetical protein [Actinomycetota bacterium]